MMNTEALVPFDSHEFNTYEEKIEDEALEIDRHASGTVLRRLYKSLGEIAFDQRYRVLVEEVKRGSHSVVDQRIIRKARSIQYTHLPSLK
jgi:Mn-dependent DtxR family transcriptional regulator